MKLGVATVVTDEGIRPDVLAKALEERGFDSLLMAEHSHIPASRATPFPAGGELPREYYRSYDPFVALTAAALATSKHNARSSSFPPNPNRKRSNCSTALRHSPKHTAEPGPSADTSDTQADRANMPNA